MVVLLAAFLAGCDGDLTLRPTCSAIPANAYAVQLIVASFVPQRRRGDSETGPTIRVEFPTSSAP